MVLKTSQQDNVFCRTRNSDHSSRTLRTVFTYGTYGTCAIL